MEMVLESVILLIVASLTVSFNPSSNGNGAGIITPVVEETALSKVSILLLMEMVLESIIKIEL